jgi:hypothetical protein
LKQGLISGHSLGLAKSQHAQGDDEQQSSHLRSMQLRFCRATNAK